MDIEEIQQLDFVCLLFVRTTKNTTPQQNLVLISVHKIKDGTAIIVFVSTITNCIKAIVFQHVDKIKEEFMVDVCVLMDIAQMQVEIVLLSLSNVHQEKEEMKGMFVLTSAHCLISTGSMVHAYAKVVTKEISIIIVFVVVVRMKFLLEMCANVEMGTIKTVMAYVLRTTVHLPVLEEP